MTRRSSTVLILIASGISLVSAMSSCAPTLNTTYAPNRYNFTHKASTDERAVAYVARLSTKDKALYHRGLQHVSGRVGSYTIGQIIDSEYDREHPIGKISEAPSKSSASSIIESAAGSTVEQDDHLLIGSPSCLVLDKNSLSTRTSDSSWYITGRAYNRCSARLTYAEIDFNFYDSSGSQENSGVVNLNNLDAGATWSFRKAVYEQISHAGTWKAVAIKGVF